MDQKASAELFPPYARPVRTARYEVWLNVREQVTVAGEPYVEYGPVLLFEDRTDARSAAAREPGYVLIHDRSSGEVWEVARRQER